MRLAYAPENVSVYFLGTETFCVRFYAKILNIPLRYSTSRHGAVNLEIK